MQTPDWEADPTEAEEDALVWKLLDEGESSAEPMAPWMKSTATEAKLETLV